MVLASVTLCDYVLGTGVVSTFVTVGLFLRMGWCTVIYGRISWRWKADLKHMGVAVPDSRHLDADPSFSRPVKLDDQATRPSDFWEHFGLRG